MRPVQRCHMCCPSFFMSHLLKCSAHHKKLLQSVSWLLEIQYKPLTIVTYCSSASWNRDVKQLLGCLVCVFCFQVPKFLILVVFSKNWIFIQFLMLQQVTLKLKRSGIPCVAFPSWMKGSFPHLKLEQVCLQAVELHLVSALQKLCVLSFDKQVKCWRGFHNCCPNTETGAKLLHLPQILQGCALCVCGYDVSLGQTLPSSVI